MTSLKSLECDKRIYMRDLEENMSRKDLFFVGKKHIHRSAFIVYFCDTARCFILIVGRKDRGSRVKTKENNFMSFEHFPPLKLKVKFEQ